MHGIKYFLLAATIALAGKHLLRPGGRHRFNPSNLGLVAVLALVGPGQVFPQYLYWAPLETPLIAALIVITVGALWVLRAVRMLPMVCAYLVVFGTLIAAFALSGRSFVALWAADPVGGIHYWLGICASPELLIFVCFMMSDPATSPRTPLARVMYAAATAVVAAVLVFPQTTEYGIKLAILASLTITCAMVPTFDRVSRRLELRGTPELDPAAPCGLVPAFRAVPRPAAIAVVLIAGAALVGAARLPGNHAVALIERGRDAPARHQ